MGFRSHLPERAVVFGGSGFIGSHLVARLAAERVTCVSFDQQPPAEPLEGVQYVVGSILDAAPLKAAIEGADAVFALAGKSGAADGLASVEADLSLNCRSQLLLLETVRQVSPKARVVYPGSRLEYGAPKYLPVDECHPIDPQSVYALHKFAAGRYHLMYHRDYALSTVVLRISNPYGPHPSDSAGRYSILNRMIDLAIADEVISVFGTGKQQRDYIYIDDLVDALFAAAVSRDVVGRVVNIGSGRPTRLLDAAQTIVRLAGSGHIEHVPWPENWSKVETGDSYFNVCLAEELLGWSPTIGLEDGLQRSLTAARG